MDFPHSSARFTVLITTQKVYLKVASTAEAAKRTFLAFIHLDKLYSPDSS
jgi:hypothetical protein